MAALRALSGSCSNAAPTRRGAHRNAAPARAEFRWNRANDCISNAQTCSHTQAGAAFRRTHTKLYDFVAPKSSVLFHCQRQKSESRLRVVINMLLPLRLFAPNRLQLGFGGHDYIRLTEFAMDSQCRATRPVECAGQNAGNIKSIFKWLMCS